MCVKSAYEVTSQFEKVSREYPIAAMWKNRIDQVLDTNSPSPSDFERRVLADYTVTDAECLAWCCLRAHVATVGPWRTHLAGRNSISLLVLLFGLLHRHAL